MTRNQALALALALVGLAPLMPLPASAQQSADVHFQRGNYGTMVSGSIIGHEYMDYRLGANAGQRMFVELTVAGSNGSGNLYFNILPPHSTGEAIYNGSIYGNSTTVDLPVSGTYVIRVYHMGNDRDTGRTSGFNLDLSIQ